MDGTTWKVSTQDPNKAVTFNENCAGMFVSPIYNDEDMSNKLLRLTKISFDNVDTSKTTTMESMFVECLGLTSLDLSKFDTSNVANMRDMFEACVNLTSLNLSGFNTLKTKNMDYMFTEYQNLSTIYVGENWSTNNVTEGKRMFDECKNLPNYDSSITDVTKAHTGSDGYLTLKQ